MALFVDIEKQLGNFKLVSKFEAHDCTTGILGASGGGKSLVLRCIAGLITPDRGQIILNGRVLFDSDKKIDIAPGKRDVGLMFQNYCLFPNMTVMDNLTFGLHALPKKEQKEIALEYAELTGVKNLLDRYPKSLSGGEQQRTALARALCKRPACLLLDEPFSALDTHIRGDLLVKLKVILDNFKGACLFISHNVDECFRISRDIIVMESGSVSAAGPRETIYSHPPTLSCARLMGCGNISSVAYDTGDKVFARDWGIELYIDKSDSEYVGVYSYNIKPCTEHQTKNTFRLYEAEAEEGPYEVHVKLSPVDFASSRRPLTMTVPIDVYKSHDGNVWNVHIDEKHIFYPRRRLKQ